MRNRFRGLVRLAVLGLALALTAPDVFSQAPVEPNPEDNLTPADFTKILKEAWSYLKEETDGYQTAIGSKSEFETTSEFEQRTVEARQQYLTKITKYYRDKKFDQRVFGVLFKASLDKYDADNQLYTVTCPTVVEAPYDIPTILTEVPANPYVGLADSITKGYRTSSIYLKFDPKFLWQVARDVARTAKADEGEVYFKVRFVVQMGQGTGKKISRFTIAPRQILLINKRTDTVYWQQSIRS